MRKLIAIVFNYSVNGLLADEDTEYHEFCEGLPGDPADVAQGLDFLRSADAHIMGRVAYEDIAAHLPAMRASGNPSESILTAAPKVVFSRT